MRIHHFTLLATLIPVLDTNAQINLTAADNLPIIGNTFLYHVAAYAAPAAGGTDVNFDFSTLVETGTTTWQWIDPATYSNPAVFPTATIAAVNGADTIFYNTTSSGLERVGERQLILGLYDVEVPFTDASLNLELPNTVGGTWNDNIAATYLAGTYPSTRSGTITGTVDATGWVTLPGGGSPIPVVRVNTYTQEVNIIETDLFDVTVVHKRNEYAYYGQFLKTPLVRAYTDSLTSSIGVNQNTNHIEWIDADPVGLSELMPLSNLMVFPNPVQTTATILFPASTGTVRIEVLDAMGREVMTVTSPANKPMCEFNVASLPAGSYTVRLRTDLGIQGVSRMVKN